MRIGIAVIVKRGNEFLVGKRGKKSRDAVGIIAVPGGVCEENETIIQCSIREVLEETGMVIKVKEASSGVVDAALAVSDWRPYRQVLTVWMLAEWVSGEPQVKEPDKCEWWKFVNVEWVEQNVLQVGQQPNWTPLDLWKKILPLAGFIV